MNAKSERINGNPERVNGHLGRICLNDSCRDAPTIDNREIFLCVFEVAGGVFVSQTAFLTLSNPPPSHSHRNLPNRAPSPPRFLWGRRCSTGSTPKKKREEVLVTRCGTQVQQACEETWAKDQQPCSRRRRTLIRRRRAIKRCSECLQEGDERALVGRCSAPALLLTLSSPS